MELANKQTVLISFILAVCAALIGKNVLFVGIGLLLILLVYVYGERFILAAIIISLFTLVGEASQSIRIFVQVIDIGLLGYLFLKRFGFQFYLYPQIPRFLFYFLLLYYFSMIASSLMSDYPLAGFVLIARQTLFFVIAYIFYALINDEKDVRNYFLAFLIATCILATSSVVSFAMEGSFLSETGRNRFAGLISNPDAATAFYMISFPLMLAILLLRKETSKRTISFFLLFYFSIALFLTISRSAILGILVSTLIVFFILRKKYFYRIIVFLSVIILVFVIYEPLRDFASLLLRAERGLTGRDLLWSVSLDMIRDHPIFGIGMGVYKVKMLQYFPAMLNSWQGEVLIKLYNISGGDNLSHNFFLFFFSDMGIFGFITSLALPIIFFRAGVKTLTKYKEVRKDIFYLIVALFAAGASLFIRAMVDSIGLLYYGVITADLPFWIVFGSLIYFYNHNPSDFVRKDVITV